MELYHRVFVFPALIGRHFFLEINLHLHQSTQYNILTMTFFVSIMIHLTVWYSQPEHFPGSTSFVVLGTAFIVNHSFTDKIRGWQLVDVVPCSSCVNHIEFDSCLYFSQQRAVETHSTIWSWVISILAWQTGSDLAQHTAVCEQSLWYPSGWQIELNFPSHQACHSTGRFSYDQIQNTRVFYKVQYSLSNRAWITKSK